MNQIKKDTVKYPLHGEPIHYERPTEPCMETVNESLKDIEEGRCQDIDEIIRSLE